MMRLLPLAAIFLLFLGQPAEAAPVAAVFAAIGKAFAASLTVKALATAALRTLISVGVSMLLEKYQKGKQRDPGLVTNHTTSGGNDPQATIVGLYATGGHATYLNAHGSNHVFNTHVIELGDLPGASLRRMIIDGEYSELGEDEDPKFGRPILSKVDGGKTYAWVRFYDGTQTVADSDLVELFGADEERPWTADHILTGVPYAILTFYRDERMFPNGQPEYRFEMDGPGFYDPRRDSSVGGDGTQRWNDQTSWDQTANLMVIAYSILRGIRLPCGRIYGGDIDADDLPLFEWFAAFDACDLGVGDENRPQFRGGYEVKFEEVPADILKELFAACNAQVVEAGGYWFPLVGDSGPAVVEINLEDDLLVSEAWQQDPFPGIESTFNGIAASHPSPEALWNAKPLEMITRTDWVAEDGGTKVFDLNLPMASSAPQVRQICNALLKENRRFRTHKWPMLPEHFFLRPLKTINATSAEHGYVAKTFRITEMAYDLRTLTPSVSVRETDPADFDPDLALELPSVAGPSGPILPVDAGVPGFAVVTAYVINKWGENQVSAVRALWDGSLKNSARAVTFQAKLASDEGEILTASTSDVEAGEFLLSPLASNSDYLVRAMAISNQRKTIWTDWLPVRSSKVVVSSDLLDDAFWKRLDEQAAAAATNLYGNMDITLDRIVEMGIDGRVSEQLKTGQIEGRLEETRETLEAQFNGFNAFVEQTGLAFATQTEALAQVQTSLSAEVEEVSASLTQNYFTSAQTNQAISAQTSTLSSQLNGFSTTVQAVSQSVNGVLGLTGWYINNNDVISGIGQMSELIDGNVTSEIVLNADNIRFVNSSGQGSMISPFQVIGGQTYIRDLFVQDGSFGTLKIAGNAITVPVFAQGGLLTGNGSFQTGATAVMNLPHMGDVIIFWSVEQGYAGYDRPWGFRVLANGVVLKERTGMAAPNDYPAGVVSLSNVVGLQTIQFEWVGANSGITGRASMRLLGRMR